MSVKNFITAVLMFLKPGTISTWEKLYHSYGFSGLLAKKRGRPSMKKSKSKYKVNKPKKELSYVEQLEQEVYQLRIIGRGLDQRSEGAGMTNDSK